MVAGKPAWRVGVCCKRGNVQGLVKSEHESFQKSEGLRKRLKVRKVFRGG